MKTYIRFIFFVFLCSWLWTSCQEEVETYEGGSGIYLKITSQTFGLQPFSFGMYHRDTVQIVYEYEVAVVGNLADFDRPFVFKSVENDTFPARAGIDYEILDKNPVIKKGEANAFVRVKFIRNPELIDHPKYIRFELEENEYFTFLRPMYHKTPTTVINVRLDEEVDMPWWWGYYGEDRFGEYSRTKSMLICDVMGISRIEWIELSGERMDESFLTFVATYMANWLKEQKEKGDPVYDERKPGMTEDPLMEMGWMANPR